MIYQPTWNSLRNHMTPQWFRDAKFGIYTHWGVYSVHATGPNTTWYAYHMYYKGSKQYEQHRMNYGGSQKFGYKDFIPMFKAEEFDPNDWAGLFKEAGAKFAGPVGEHHDGFSMWDTKLSKWNSVKMGPKRNIVGELEEAIRKQGMKYMVALHHAENWWFFPHWLKQYDTSDPLFQGLYGESHDMDWAGRPQSDYYRYEDGPEKWSMQEKPSKKFLDTWLGKIKEVIDDYRPDMLWFDFGLGLIQEHYKREFLAYYYNMAETMDKEVVVTYKFHDLVPGSGVIDLELGRFNKMPIHEWITDTTVDDGCAWGYMKDVKYKTASSLIHYLVDNVSKNGYMLLNVGPRADGTIPDEARQILKDIGKWLSVNGEAVYGTNPWVIYGEGPTKMTKSGMFSENEELNYTAEDIRFTEKGNILYATCLNWPEGEILIKSAADKLYGSEIVSVSMLGSKEGLTWKFTRSGLLISAPRRKPCEHAYVFKVERKHPFE